MAFKRVQHISVTMDYLRQLPVYDIVNNPDHLQAALHLVGFDLVDIDENGEKKPAKIDRLTNVNVRCNNKPYLSRKCLVFAGRMREGFKYSKLYDGVDILDVAVVPDTAPLDVISDFAFEVPVIDKVNTRKYTKREDRSDTVDLDVATEYTQDELETLSRIFGE